MSDRSRLEDLERRVSHDPASIAFAQLAEEYRRAGRIEDAVRVCRAGLETHPTYGSARVTLARALIEMGQHHEAKTELERVVHEAPDNLVAIRVLSELRRHWSIDERPLHVPAFEPSELDVPDALIPSEFVDGSSSFQPDAPLGPIDDQAGSEDASLYLSGTAGEGASGDRHPRSSVMPPELQDARHSDRNEHEPDAASATPARDGQALRALESWLDAILHDRSTRP